MAPQVPATTGHRLLSVFLTLELVWLLLVAASLVFLAAHLSGDPDDITGGPASRRMLLLTVPPFTVGLGLALIGARQAVERRGASLSPPLRPRLQVCLWLTAAANAAIVVSILTSLYHARATWVVVGLMLAVGLSLVAASCIRCTRR
jgi:hypothetical protein